MLICSCGLMGLLLIGQDAYAQCGSLGDPIVNIDFGVGEPDFGGGKSTYQRVPGSPADGQYTLSTNANFGNGWHNMPDRSGNGYMLVVNADDNQAGEFYRIPVRGLCENTNFYFSAYVANINPPEQIYNPCGGNIQLPNVRFLILDMAGNELVSFETMDIPVSASPEWKEYGVFFNTGNQTEFQLVLINNNIGGCGNDLAIDDIQFRPCGPQITLETNLTIKQADTLFFCEDQTDPIRINGEINANDGYAVTPVRQWQTRRDDEVTWQDIAGANGEQLDVLPTPNRWYRLLIAATPANFGNTACRVSSDSIRIAQVVRPPDVTEVNVRGPICVGGSLSLELPEYVGANVGPVTSYQWQIDDGLGMVDITAADSSGYLFQGHHAGRVHLQRRVVTACGDAFVTHLFEVEVQEPLQPQLVLPQTVVCADEDSFVLTGGTFLNSDVEGVYSGIGVVDGQFYPALAGAGEHTVTFSTPPDALCGASVQATLTVVDTVSLEPLSGVVMLKGQRVTLYPQTDATQLRWSNQPGLDHYDILTPTASPDETTTYTLTARNAVGCEKQMDVTVTVLKDLAVPNAFSPNDDGFNDTWEIDGLAAYPNVVIQVFDRWGTRVFSSKGYSVPWDGRFNGVPLPVGAYYYTLSSDLLAQPLSGSVSILK